MFGLFQSQIRVVFDHEVGTVSEFKADFSKRFLKISPDDDCFITNYTISKVLKDQIPIDKEEFSKLVNITDKGVLQILKFD